MNEDVAPNRTKRNLSDYLRRKGSEVVNMLIAEYDYDMDIEVQREEAYEDGVAAGVKAGKIQGAVEAYSELHLTKEEACEKLAQKFSITSEDALEYVEKYWR